MRLRFAAISRWSVVVVLLCLASPGLAQSLPSPEANRGGKLPRIPDVRLGPRGTLQGMVVTSTGRPVADLSLTLMQGSRPLARAVTDSQGRFVFENAPPGAYQITLGTDQLAMVRLWSPGQAPPQAADSLLVVSGAGVTRGQRRIGQILANENALVVGGMVAAAVAIPVAIAASDKDVEPISP